MSDPSLVHPRAANELVDTLRAALDPAVLMRRCAMEPDDWQARALRSRAGRQLWLCARQSGKSTVAAALALHEVLYTPGALVLMVSPSLRQSQELFRKALMMYRTLGQTVPAEAESALRIELANGSRVISLPAGEGHIRGYSASLILLDEASRIPDDLFIAIRPMVAITAGRIIAMSTPAGLRGWFSAEWHAGEGWERMRIVATECPRISAAFLESERATMGGWQFEQEYMCAFVEEASQAFPGALVDQAFDPAVTPLW